MTAVQRRGQHAFEHALHEGRGPMTIEQHFAGESELPLVVQTWTLGPGAFEGMHRHDDPPLEELYLVTEGRARVRQGGQEHLLGPGDSLRSPVGAEHDLANAGDEPLRVVVIWGPPGSIDLSGFGSVRRALELRAEDGGSASAEREQVSGNDAEQGSPPGNVGLSDQEGA